MLGPFVTASRRTPIHQVSLLSHAATVARRLRIDVHDNNDDDNNNDNDNAWQRGPLWPHRMGPIKRSTLTRTLWGSKRTQRLACHRARSVHCRLGEESADASIQPQSPWHHLPVHFLTGTALGHCSIRDYCSVLEDLSADFLSRLIHAV